MQISVDERTCEVSAYMHLRMYRFNGDTRHVTGETVYIHTPCVSPGDVELEIEAKRATA